VVPASKIHKRRLFLRSFVRCCATVPNHVAYWPAMIRVIGRDTLSLMLIFKSSESYVAVPRCTAFCPFIDVLQRSRCVTKLKVDDLRGMRVRSRMSRDCMGRGKQSW